jgi:hypothetical protein
MVEIGFKCQAGLFASSIDGGTHESQSRNYKLPAHNIVPEDRTSSLAVPIVSPGQLGLDRRSASKRGIEKVTGCIGSSGATNQSNFAGRDDCADYY